MKRVFGVLGVLCFAACAREPAGPLESSVDLAVDGIDASPTIPMVGEAVLLKATIANLGTEVVTGGSVSFYMTLDGDSLWSPVETVGESIAVPVLVPGERVVAKARVDSLPLGVLDFQAILDQVDDDGANNQDTLPVVADPLRIHIIDVGQGDAALLELPGGVDVLVDGGNLGAGPVVLDYLASNDVDSLDLIVATHLDEDHYGGLTALLNSGEVVVDQLWLPCGRTIGPPSLVSFKNAYRNHAGLDTLVVGSGASLEGLGSVVRFEAIHPASSPIEPCDDTDRNEQSIVCRVEFGDFSALLTGDIGEAAESEILGRAEEVDVDLVKIPHHGSAGSSSRAFVDAVSASWAIASVGANNEYGHPDDGALARWSDSGAILYRTDLDGTIVWISDGAMVRVEGGGGS